MSSRPPLTFGPSSARSRQEYRQPPGFRREMPHQQEVENFLVVDASVIVHNQVAAFRMHARRGPGWKNDNDSGAIMPDSICSILADLTGQDAPFGQQFEADARKLLSGKGLGYSQLNELLLLLGYDGITRSLFQYIVDGSTEYKSTAALKSIDKLRDGVDRVRKLAILSYGNVKYGFKYLSNPTTDLAAELAGTPPVDPKEFKSRHDPLLPPDPIPGGQTYYLGYLIKRELDNRIRQNRHDQAAKQQLQDRERIVEKGRRNHQAYLVSNHIDVYVATSMRERYEYQIVSRVVQEVFHNSALLHLKLRWFDPTQAYCDDRIDKGLAEGLMLKRAACTLYLAQESDTFGKDSELASTLAQGKPVIAYTPRVSKKRQQAYVEELLKMVAKGVPEPDERKLVLGQLRVFAPERAWTDTEVKQWVAKPQAMDLGAAKRKLGEAIRAHYDERADTLKESHPLGIQVNLETGVANGVLVARTTAECAKLIYGILTRTLEFRICEKMIDGNRYLLLKEKSTDSVFRVVTGDRFLTNAFWNFYLAK